MGEGQGRPSSTPADAPGTRPCLEVPGSCSRWGAVTWGLLSGTFISRGTQTLGGQQAKTPPHTIQAAPEEFGQGLASQAVRGCWKSHSLPDMWPGVLS